MSIARPARGIVLAACLLAAVFVGCARQAKHPAERVYLHKVESGETLAGIAEDYYGDPGRTEAIEKFNDVTDESIAPGTVLRVPMTAKDIERLETREKARVSYNEGLELVEAGSYLDAVGRFREALSIDPDFADAMYNLGVTLHAMKSYEKAREQLERAAELRPANADYRYALGNSLFHLGDFSRAARAFERVMEIDPENAKALYSLAMCYEKIGEREKAIAAWEDFLRLDATSAWAVEARKRLETLR
jgi:tetratricopeptide (TPR) repeat protein